MQHGEVHGMGQLMIVIILLYALKTSVNIRFSFLQRLNKLIIPDIEEKREDVELGDREGNQAALLKKDKDKNEQKA